jgi:hypothetical protein
MGKRALIGVLAALSTAAPASASHQYDDTARCASKTVRSVQIVTSSSEAIAFRKAKRVDGRTVYRTYACMRRSGPITFLKRSEFSGSTVAPRLAGRYVAFRRLDELNEFVRASGLVVLDMSTGEVKLETPRGESHLDSFVVKRNGSAGWVNYPYEEGVPSAWKADVTTGGAPAKIDEGEIRQLSLRLSADRRELLWTKSDSRRSAPID